ncbi:MAG TPA: hypothetical protein VLY23_05045 [Candidatus Acidoferrum sp.]|nr:hypothetical protein [Candidatus Acidoferrum sp.]
MRSLGLAAAVFLAAVASGCGSNTTTIGVSVSPTGSSPNAPYSVIKGGTQIFTASVAGGSTTTVYWQICLAPPITSPPTEPTTCTPIPGVKSLSTWTLTGYGTITQNGLYTAPTTIPQQNPFVIMAVSQVDYTAFGISYISIDSGIRVQMNPTTATIGTQETFTVTANVTGTASTGVTWSVNDIAGGDATNGTITPTGPQTALYQAPATALSATVKATSTADPTESGTTTIIVTAAADPTLDSVDPTTAAQGSVQQDIYVTGSGFLSTSVVLVNGTPLPTTLISATLMRATIPSTLLTQSGSFAIRVQRQNGDLNLAGSNGAVNLSVITPRPSVVASAPDSIPATNAGFGVSLTGGFFASGTTSATFNSFTGPSLGVSSTIGSSRQMTVNIPAGSLSTPGLYPIVVHNSGVTTGPSSTSAANIAVTPAAGTLLSSPTATVGVGSNPSAVAIDEADGLALVVNTGSNTVSVVSLATNSVVQTVAVGNNPTGIAVDDGLLPPLDHVALVVNSADNTVSAIDLTTFAVSTLTLPPLPSGSTPYSVGVNPITHHAVVANSLTNLATILDLSTGAPVYLQEIGGGLTNYGTGTAPAIAIDPRLNWAVVSAGGGGNGSVNLVDLGRDAIAGVDAGRAPSVVGTLTLTSSGSGVQGVGINGETHQVLLTAPTVGGFPMFSLLDQSVSAIAFQQNGVIVNQPGYVAAAVSSLANMGVAINTNANAAAILDLQGHIVIENVATGNQPVAVAVDPGTNEALVVNQADGTVSILSLGTVRSSASLGAARAPQITLSSPEIAFTSSNSLTLTLTGGGFAAGAQALLDGTVVPSVVSADGRQIVATVPAAMLTAARRYSVYVQNPGQAAISNIEDLIIVQPVLVGASPFGVAVDSDCDLAAVTNSGDGTVSIVALTPNAPAGQTLCANNGAVGTVGAPIPVGTTPQGIAIEPRLGVALVANNGSDNASVVDLAGMGPPSTFQLCGGSCTNVTAVAMNQDGSTAYVADVLSANGSPAGNVSEVAVSRDTSGFASGTPGGVFGNLDLTPTSIAFDPYLEYVGVATAGLESNIDIINLTSSGTPTRVTGLTGAGLQVPMGIIFDPVNQVFLAANSLVNNIIFVDPTTAIAGSSQVGMNPTSLDYNYQTSTLVTANNASNTVSIADYVCPPNILNNCSGPQVRSILALGSSPQFSVAIDRTLNLAVLADQSNNRVLLIPLP